MNNLSLLIQNIFDFRDWDEKLVEFLHREKAIDS